MEYPESVRFLHDIALALQGRSGVGMSLSPLRPTELESWCRQQGIALSLLEQRALLAISDALLVEWTPDDDAPSNDTTKARQSRVDRLRDAQDRARKLRKE